MAYRKDLDALKGIAIIAVVLFHMGLLKSGYLGVDSFFVINGFLIIPSLCRRIESKEFSYFIFLERRIIRLLPLVVLASIASLLIGFIGMLPDNYENVAESVVASNLFSENILSAVTTKNYWNAANDYKPLMHLWYIGILFEFYLIFPLLLLALRWCINRFTKNSQNTLLYIVAGIFIASLVAFLLPFDSESNKFYFVHYRLFELSLGGLAGMCYIGNKSEVKLNWMWILLLLFIVFSSIITFNIHNIGNQVPVIGGSSDLVDTGLINSKSTLLILVVILSSIVVFQNNDSSHVLNCGFLAEVGKRSYSIFIWHQVLLAFYRYFVSAEVTIPFIVGYLIVVTVVSELSYRFVEKKIQDNRKTFIIWVILAIVTTGIAGLIYLHAGVVRDVPEQNITVNNVHRNMHAEYCDRVYQYDVDFPEDNGKINVLVEGVSFGRDFANCLLESQYADSVNLSYVYTWGTADLNRIQNADFIFSFTSREGVPQAVWNNKKESAQVWGIGTKNYGECNGIIYSHRFSKDYLQTTIEPHPGYLELNKQWKLEWGNNYIDFMGMAMNDEGRIRVFTPDGKFISQDCEHLTKEGAQWYGSIINWEDVFRAN